MCFFLGSLFCNGYVFRSSSVSLHSLKSLVAVLRCLKVYLVLVTVLLVLSSVVPTQRVAITLLPVQSKDIERCSVKVWWKHKHLVPILRHGVHTPPDRDWMEEKKALCFYRLKHNSSVCMGLKGLSARGRQASISLVSKVFYSQHNSCSEPAVRVVEPGQYLLLFLYLFTSCQFHIEHKCHQQQCCVLMIAKRQACSDIFSISGNRQEPETASIPVNWIVGETVFPPSGQLALSIWIHPTKHSSSKTRMLCLSCLLGIARPWFWPPEYPWELLGRVLSQPRTKACQELFSNLSVGVTELPGIWDLTLFHLLS